MSICEANMNTSAEQVGKLMQEVKSLSADLAEEQEKSLFFSVQIEALFSELRKLKSISPGVSARSYTISGMYGYVEAISLDSLTDSQKSRLDSGLRGFLNGEVPFTEYIELEVRKAFSDRFIKFLEEIGLQVQKSWLGFDINDTKRPGVNAHKLQALHLYHGYALESPNSLHCGQLSIVEVEKASAIVPTIYLVSNCETCGQLRGIHSHVDSDSHG
ncbi:hypothetical protein BGX38DRAFT_1276037 [Terfezia claveryi]|nr:hypothetical protein BGX38DRAFT_1276037 [Terfezia claveryi]